MNYNKISIQRTAHYVLHGDLAKAQTLTLGCHGYGQLATYLARKWSGGLGSEHALVSAEGLNKFYWEGTGGRPVATWMTSHHRLDEIADFTAYLDALWRQYVAGAERGRRVLFGFSQGGTSMWRYIHACRPDFDVFVNWAGWVPEDIDLGELQDYLRGRRLIYVMGDADQYSTEDSRRRFEDIVAGHGLELERVGFAGPHRVDETVLRRVYASL